jgi:predicted dehydrogenase
MIRLGIVGAGQNATEHARYFAACPRAKIIAVADPVETACTRLAREVGARAVPQMADLLGAVDAVVISSPNVFHKEQCVEACAAGVHVFCEKPVGLCGDDARVMADAAAKARIKSMVGFVVWISPEIQTMQRLVEAGEIGDIVSLWSRRLMYSDPAKTSGWRKDPAQSGGLLLEVNVHELDWLMKIGGEVDSVYARMKAQTDRHPLANDHLWVTLNFARGATGLHEGSWLSAMPNFFRGLHGTKGGVQTGEWGCAPIYFSRLREQRREIPVAPAIDLRAHFLDCIEHNATPHYDLRWGEKVMRVVDACFQSAHTNAVVKVLAAGTKP